jgi:hypothetical protein
MAVKQVFNTSAELDFPNVLPTLDLDFANSKTLDPRITFTRSSGGSYVGADGLIKYAGVNEARFDHDPSTGESLGLLIEEARTNAMIWSEDPQSAWSIKSGVTVSNSTFPSPDGNASGMKLVLETNTFQDHYLERLVSSVNANQSITFSVFLKSFSRNIIAINLYDGSSYSNRVTSWYNLSTGVASNFTSGGTGTFQSASVKNWGNGIYQLILTGIPTSSSSTSVRPRIQIINQSTTYLGNDSSGFYIWGAQAEQGAFPTSYIPTQGSTRTRAADIASITGKNFSEWYRQDEGTMFVDYKLITNGSTARVFNIDNGTNNIRISGLCGNTVFQTFILPENKGPSITFPSTFNFKVASVHKDYNVFNYLNGKYFNFETGRTMIIPKTLNTLRIGNWAANTLQGTIIKKLTYFPKRLPNSQLISLTT